MINEEEAFWAGIAVATMMLGGGFSMLFLRTYTGYGAVVLALGLLTMAMTIQLRARPDEHAEVYVPNASPELTPTPPIQSTEDTTQPKATEAEAEQTPQNKLPEEPAQQAQQTQPQPTPPEAQPETPPAEPVATPQPQAPAPNVEPPKPEEPPKEEQPQVVPAVA